jgi:hypothetical protein
VTLERESAHSRINVVRAYYRYHPLTTTDQAAAATEAADGTTTGRYASAGSLVQLAVPWSVHTLAVWYATLVVCVVCVDGSHQFASPLPAARRGECWPAASGACRCGLCTRRAKRPSTSWTWTPHTRFPFAGWPSTATTLVPHLAPLLVVCVCVCVCGKRESRDNQSSPCVAYGRPLLPPAYASSNELFVLHFQLVPRSGTSTSSSLQST